MGAQDTIPFNFNEIELQNHGIILYESMSLAKFREIRDEHGIKCATSGQGRTKRAVFEDLLDKLYEKFVIDPAFDLAPVVNDYVPMMKCLGNLEDNMIMVTGTEITQEDIPAQFICPITQEVFQDPVVLGESGQTYDRSALVKALEAKPGVDPITNCTVGNAQFAPNHLIRSMMAEQGYTLTSLSAGASNGDDDLDGDDGLTLKEITDTWKWCYGENMNEEYSGFIEKLKKDNPKLQVQEDSDEEDILYDWG